MTHYFNTLGLPDRTLLFDTFSADALRDHILSGWESRGALRAALEKRIPELRVRSGICGRLMAAIDRGEANWEGMWRRETGN